MEDDILTIEEVAKYLRVSDRTVYDWAQKGEIPAGKIGTVWRFKKSELERWVNERLSSSSVKKSDSEVQIKNFLSPDRVIFVKNSSKRDAIIELADVLAVAPQVKKQGRACYRDFKAGRFDVYSCWPRNCNSSCSTFFCYRFGYGCWNLQEEYRRLSDC